jgi:4-carboxymuconolactone decarboxylase
MTQRIHLAAMVLREGRLMLVRPRIGAAWELPGGPFPDEQEDMDGVMDAILGGFGVEAPAIEEDFLETIFLHEGEGQIVLNVYAPSEWAGEPAVAAGAGLGWFALDELELLDMDARVRNTVLRAFGLQGTEDNSQSILSALEKQFGFEMTPESEGPPASPAEHTSRRAAGLDVLRTLSGGDPIAEETLQAECGELADAILDFSMGEVWQDPALDRRTRSLEVVAMLAAAGKLGSLRSHIGGALNHGATPEQVVETLKMVAVYAGFPAAVEAWPVMEEVFASRGIERRLQL